MTADQIKQNELVTSGRFTEDPRASLCVFWCFLVLLRGCKRVPRLINRRYFGGLRVTSKLVHDSTRLAQSGEIELFNGPPPETAVTVT